MSMSYKGKFVPNIAEQVINNTNDIKKLQTKSNKTWMATTSLIGKIILNHNEIEEFDRLMINEGDMLLGTDNYMGIILLIGDTFVEVSDNKVFITTIPGNPGQTGPTGATGPKGDQGEPGLDGAPGAQGIPGLNGAPGLTGPQGLRGLQGPQGIAGATGPKGEDGTNGTSFSITNTVPAQIDLPAAGPSYLGQAWQTEDTLDIYLCLYDGTNHLWVNQGTIQGPQGPQGIQGTKGDQGIQGIQGDQGPKGDKGDKGDQGIQGPKGDKGDKGDQGIQGPKGDKGDAGIGALVELYNGTVSSSTFPLSVPFSVSHFTTYKEFYIYAEHRDGIILLGLGSGYVYNVGNDPEEMIGSLSGVSRPNNSTPYSSGSWLVYYTQTPTNRLRLDYTGTGLPLETLSWDIKVYGRATV